MINFEDESIEISEIINQFNIIGQEKLLENLKNILPFDKFIINYFYRRNKLKIRNQQGAINVTQKALVKIINYVFK